ncbi:hypothetical protein [Ktedonobacter robiniae]|nr:hypothetical protein [Ktedonobacter robiniae]
MQVSEKMQEQIAEELFDYSDELEAADRITRRVTQELACQETVFSSLSPLEQNFPLEVGEVILGGRYRVERHLYSRPRLNLYLGRAVGRHWERGGVFSVFRWLACRWRRMCRKPEMTTAPLVAIREIVLTGLDAHRQACIETAGVEEFIEPIGLGSARLANEKDRVLFERGRLYLVLQLQSRQAGKDIEPTTLDDLLDGKPWPEWLSIARVVQWGVQLGRMIARLHRMGIILGEIAPETLLVDKQGLAPWAPLLLMCWPPAPRFWDGLPEEEAYETYRQTFPLARGSKQNAFLAPELLYGLSDERTDVYALGAMLYMLVTRVAPIAAMRRLQASQTLWPDEKQALPLRAVENLERYEGLELIPPRFWREELSVSLEQILLKALALDPHERYESVFSLVEALEAIEGEIQG